MVFIFIDKNRTVCTCTENLRLHSEIYKEEKKNNIYAHSRFITRVYWWKVLRFGKYGCRYRSLNKREIVNNVPNVRVEIHNR